MDLTGALSGRQGRHDAGPWPHLTFRRFNCAGPPSHPALRCYPWTSRTGGAKPPLRCCPDSYLYPQQTDRRRLIAQNDRIQIDANDRSSVTLGQFLQKKKSRNRIPRLQTAVGAASEHFLQIISSWVANKAECGSSIPGGIVQGTESAACQASRDAVQNDSGNSWEKKVSEKNNGRFCS